VTTPLSRSPCEAQCKICLVLRVRELYFLDTDSQTRAALRQSHPWALAKHKEAAPRSRIRDADAHPGERPASPLVL